MNEQVPRGSILIRIHQPALLGSIYHAFVE